MASGKMSSMSSGKGMVCGGCMCTTCGAISAVLVLFAGLVMFLGGYGVGNPSLDVEISGVLFLLFGLSLLVHALNACPMCKQ